MFIVMYLVGLNGSDLLVLLDVVADLCAGLEGVAVSLSRLALTF
jgi:hypothetical protein